MIRVEHVTKRYGATVAVDDASFSIERGEIVGFLGPNGAGKSTLLKMMSTWLPPTAGSIRIAGFDVRKDALAVRRSLGFLPEHNALYEDMRVDRFLNFIGRARGLKGGELAARIDWAVEACSLQEVFTKRIRQCSKGFRQRIGVGASLLHNPPVILLDEPTHGLDPLQVVAFLEFIQSLSGDRAILISSHILSEIVAISKRLLIINRGKILADTPLADLTERAAASGRELEHTVLDIVRGGEVTA